MADQNITALPVATTPESSDRILLVGATEEKLINYDELADAILRKIASKNFALDQGNKTLLAALNELNSKKSNSLYRGFYLGSNPQKFILQPFSTYILIFANVSNSNISSDCELAMIVTGNTSANTSKITWVTQSVAYMHSTFFFDTDDGLSFNIDPKSDNVWCVISLTRL